MSDFSAAQERRSKAGRRVSGYRALRSISGLVVVGALAAACGSGSANAPSSTASPGAGATATVATQTNATIGTFLVNSQGFTLYRLSTDTPNHSVCSGACAQTWPPLLLNGSGSPVAGSGVSGLGTIAGAGGQQVTYHGMPLYTFAGDSSAGATNGQNVKDQWGTWTVVVVKAPAGGGATTTTAGGGGGVGF